MAIDRSGQKDDYEVVKPPRDLRSKVRVLSPREAARFDPVKAAEAALEKLSADFDDWMANEALALSSAYTDIQENGMSDERRDTLFRAAHDIKGQAGTLGYPLVGGVAASLCHLIEHVDAATLPLTLVGQHVDAVRAMVAETGQKEDNPTARAIVDRLADVTEDYVSRNGTPDSD
jgi:chemotaxis protein histidine kinase CheA